MPKPIARGTVSDLVAAALTDQGLRRDHNEDAFVLAPERGLLLVADGMGGHRAGDTASTAVASVLPGMLEAKLASGRKAGDVEPALREAITELSGELQKQSAPDPEIAGLGSTVVLLLFRDDGVFVAHMGDSRAYRARSGQLARLTDDHSLVALLVRRGELAPDEADERPELASLTRYVGMEGVVYPDVRRLEPEPGDRYLLCSDGLTTMIDDAAIGAILFRSSAPEEACRGLVDAANAAGGKDNITVIVGDWRCPAR
jgi:protein phosphatase